MDKKTLTMQLAEYALTDHWNTYSELDKKMCITAFADWIAVTFAGSSEEVVEKLVNFLNTGDSPSEPCTLIGLFSASSLLNAALINGTSSHVLDFDDIHDFLSLHLESPIFPPVIALAEHLHLSGREVITAAMIGMQIMTALSAGIMPEHYACGWHATATLGIFGAVASCGYLMKLSPEQMCHAFGHAASRMAGLQASFGSMAKSIQTAQACQNAILSVQMAANGFTASTDIFDNSFLENISTRVDRSSIVERLSGSQSIYELRFKRYPCGAPTHSGIINCKKLFAEHHIDYKEIEKIVLEPYPRAIRLAGNPHPRTGLEGKFSIPYTAAAQMVYGKVLIETFTDEMVNHPDIIELLNKTEMVPNEEFLPSRGGRTTLYLKDGRTFSHATYLLGQAVDPDEQIQEVREKFMEITVPLIGELSAQSLYQSIQALETVADICELTKLL